MPGKEWSGATEEKKYWSTADVFIKSTLRENDWQHHHETGEKYRPKMGTERARNEAVNLKFIGECTNIPVPKVICEYEDNGAYVIVMSQAKGVRMDTLTPSEKTTVMPKVEIVMDTLHRLRSSRIGGASGLVCPPHPVLNEIPHEECQWSPMDADSDIYVFCHMDAHMTNIYVDPLSLEITSLVDFEFAGFYPQHFDLPLYQYEPSRVPDRTEFARKFLDFLELCQERKCHRIPTNRRASSGSIAVPRAWAKEDLVAQGKGRDEQGQQRLQRSYDH